MKINKEDLIVVSEIFKTLDKAKFNDMDGDDIISVYRSFVNLRKLEDKLSKIIQEQEEAEVKKASASKSKKKTKKKSWV